MLSADDGIVSSVESGNAPREVMVWIFSSFGGHLFDLIKGGRGYYAVIFVILFVVQGRFSLGVKLCCLRYECVSGAGVVQGSVLVFLMYLCVVGFLVSRALADGCLLGRRG